MLAGNSLINKEHVGPNALMTLMSLISHIGDQRMENMENMQNSELILLRIKLLSIQKSKFKDIPINTKYKGKSIFDFIFDLFIQNPKKKINFGFNKRKPKSFLSKNTCLW